jgi:hypothetical protein
VLALVRLPSVRSKAALLASAAALLCLPAAARAAAPVNDAFGNAAPLSAGVPVLGNNLGATAEGAEPSPTPNAASPACSHVTDGPNCATSVWYSFQAPTTANYTIDTCDLGTDVDAIVSVWTGSGLGSLSLAPSESDSSCSDAGSGVSFDAQAGNTYRVDVEGYQAQQGVFYLRAYPTSAPPSAGGPDTLIERLQSLAFARLELNGGAPFGNDIQSGPRQTASFDFSSDTAGASFECSMDGAAFAACSSPVSYDGLDSGEHTFKVRAVVGGVPDPTPAVQIFHIDHTPPDTGITGPVGSVNLTSAAWDLSTSDPSYEYTYKCEFDSSAPFFCNSPHVAYSNLCAGNHELQAAAFDQANNLDPTPAAVAINTDGSAGDDCGAPDPVGTPSVGQTATSADVSVSFADMGSGGTLRLDWGTTTAYGSSMSQAVLPGDTSADLTVFFLAPSTQYHYRLTLTNPLGSSVGADHTFTTDSLSGTLPDVSQGAAEVVGAHAVAIPINIDPHGSTISQYGVYIDDAPITPVSPFVQGADSPSGTTPFQSTVDVVDLAPSTTYHVRAWVIQGLKQVETGERTFTTPAVSPPASAQPPPQPLPPAPVQPAPRFRLKSREVHLGGLRRSSKTLTLTVNGLPAGALVNVQLSAGLRASAVKTLAKAHARANAKGVAKLRLKLSGNARKLLRNRRVKSVTIRVAATVPPGTPTTVTLHKRLR